MPYVEYLDSSSDYMFHLTFTGPCIIIYFYSKTNKMHQFLKILVWDTSHKYKSKGKGKAIPLQPWTGPEGSRRLRLPDFKTIGT